MKIKAKPLTQDAFAKFGTVLSSSFEQPMADNAEITYWGKVSVLNMGGLISTGILIVYDREHVVTQMERHVGTSEILAAMEGDSVICFAAPKDEIDNPEAFLIRQGGVIALHAGTWHWAGYPLNRKSAKFLIVFANGTEANDLETKSSAEEIEIQF